MDDQRTDREGGEGMSRVPVRNMLAITCAAILGSLILAVGVFLLRTDLGKGNAIPGGIAWTVTGSLLVLGAGAKAWLVMRARNNNPTTPLMPRFTMKSMLIAFAVVALWLSTAFVYKANQDVRYSIVLLIVVASGVKTYCSGGRQRCFWLAFFLVLLATAYTQQMIAPQLGWVIVSLQPFVTTDVTYGSQFGGTKGSHLLLFISTTIILATDLILAAVAGFIGRYIYDQNRSQ